MLTKNTRRKCWPIFTILMTLNSLVLTKTPDEVVATFPYLSDLKKVRLPGVVRPVDRAACGGVAEQFAAAHHGMDGATKVQWSRRGRITPALLDALP